MKTMTRLELVAALLLGGCSLVINSGDYTGGEPRDGGVTDSGRLDGAPSDSAADSGPGDTGTPDAGACGQCTGDQVMSWSGHCYTPRTDCGCMPGEICDPFGFCVPRDACPGPPPGTGYECGVLGWVPMCECDAEQSYRPDPTDPTPGSEACLPCDPSFEHWSEVALDCVPGTVSCDTRPCPAGEICQVVPGDGSWCVPDGGIEPGCVCASGELCVEGGRCVSPGTCDIDFNVPNCSGGAGGMGGTISAFRVLARPFMTSDNPRDLHIVGSLFDEASSGGVPAPGWSMVWRDGSDQLQGAYADAIGDVAMSCYQGGPLGRVSVCGDTIIPRFEHMDARTLYAGSTGSPTTALATATATGVNKELKIWKLQSLGSTPYPGGVCINSFAGADTTEDAVGVSLNASGPGALAYATLGAHTLANFSGTGSYPLVTGTADATLPGPLASSYSFGFYSNQMRRGFTVWSLGSSAVFSIPGAGRANTDPVAAIDVTGSADELFVYARDDKKIDVVRCSEGFLRPGCTREATMMVSPLALGRPIAAFSSFNVVTVLALEGMGGSMQLTARTDSTTVFPLLTESIVGGRIVDLLAVDAEGVAGSSGWDWVWAAFVIVDRRGDQSLELWTGGRRDCT